jgi:hypothetical protein
MGAARRTGPRRALAPLPVVAALACAALTGCSTARLLRRLFISASRSATRSRSTAQFSFASRFSASQLLEQRGPATSTTLLPSMQPVRWGKDALDLLSLEKIDFQVLHARRLGQSDWIAGDIPTLECLPERGTRTSPPGSAGI